LVLRLQLRLLLLAQKKKPDTIVLPCSNYQLDDDSDGATDADIYRLLLVVVDAEADSSTSSRPASGCEDHEYGAIRTTRRRATTTTTHAAENDAT